MTGHEYGRRGDEAVRHLRGELRRFLRARGGVDVRTADRVAESTLRVFVEGLELDPEEVRAETYLHSNSRAGGLDVESLDLLNIVFRYEKALDVKIGDGSLFFAELVGEEFYDGERLSHRGMGRIIMNQPHIIGTLSDGDREKFVRTGDQSILVNGQSVLGVMVGVYDLLEKQKDGGRAEGGGKGERY